MGSHSVPLTRGGSCTGLSAAAPPSAAAPEFLGEAQLGAPRCARQPGKLGSPHLLSPAPAPQKIVRLSSSIS